MAPLYRVTDKSSRAYYVPGEGIFAEDTDTVVDFDYFSDFLRYRVKEHLNWGSRKASPFISTYKSKETAVEEARRRVRRGMKEVTVHKIDGDKSHGMEYRNVRRLARNLNLRIEEQAYHNSESEYIVAGHIPDGAIEVLLEFGRRRSRRPHRRQPAARRARAERRSSTRRRGRI